MVVVEQGPEEWLVFSGDEEPTFGKQKGRVSHHSGSDGREGGGRLDVKEQEQEQELLRERNQEW